MGRCPFTVRRLTGCTGLTGGCTAGLRHQLYRLGMGGCTTGADRGEGVPSFDEMVAIVFDGADFDDPTTNVRGRRALAIAKPTPRGY